MLVYGALLVLLISVDARTAGATPKDDLRDAATGTWSGEFGTLEFGDDGTAALSVRECGNTPLRPGFVEVFSDCEPEEYQGRLRVRTGGYVVVADDGGEYNLGAYVDEEVLYLGPGVVAQLDRTRQGTVRLGGSERLVVGDGRCSYTSAFQEEAIERKCRFVERDERTVLIYTAPDPFEGGEITRNGLVYLPGPRLLVSPEIVERPYTREATPATEGG